MLYPQIQYVGDEMWHLKKSDEDGIFVKYDGLRLKTSKGDLVGHVVKIEVPQQKSKLSKEKDSVMVSCKYCFHSNRGKRVNNVSSFIYIQGDMQ